MTGPSKRRDKAGLLGAEHLISPIMSKWPEGHHVYRQCVVCKKIFRLWLCRLKAPDRAGMFCTQKCHRIARKLFRKMLAEGLLEPLLQQVIAEEMKKAA
jgi:hypothetical protein